MDLISFKYSNDYLSMKNLDDKISIYLDSLIYNAGFYFQHI